MKTDTRTWEQLLRENECLRARLEEAEQVLRAIRHDEVDALVVHGPLGDQVYTIESAERPYRLLIEQMQEAAVTLTAENTILYTNPRFAQMLDVPPERVLAAPLVAFVLEEDRAAVSALLRESRTRICREEILLCASDGRVVPTHLTAAPLHSEGQDHICVILTDLTERKRQEAIIAAQQAEKQAAVASERSRMAQELHDTLASGLIGIKLQLDSVEDLLHTDPAQAQRYVVRARMLVQESLEGTRRTVRGLRSLELDGWSLADALLHYAEQAARDSGIPVALQVEGQAYPLPPLIESELFRIGQEAVTNALRHARAKQITLLLTFAEAVVRLQIQDDGCGFDPQAVTHGFGLRGMRERTKRVGGQFTLNGAAGQGVALNVTVPIPSAGERLVP